jgi:hypothetical protein
MNGSNTLKQVFVGILGGVGFVTVMLGFQAIANKANWATFMVCGVVLCIATPIIAKIIKA